MASNKPKLNFQTGEPILVTLVYNKPLEFNSQYGKFYQYTVLDENELEVIFNASELLHNSIKKTKAKKGDTLEILKEDIGDNKVKWIVTHKEKESASSNTNGNEKEETPNNSKKVEDNSNERNIDPVGLYLKIYSDLKTRNQDLDGTGIPEDHLRESASTIFISCTKDLGIFNPDELQAFDMEFGE